MPNQRYSYDRTQRAFHWVMAALVLAAIAFGVWAHFVPPKTPLRSAVLFWHKSLGMSVLVLVPARLAYRALVGEPAFRVPLDRLTHAAAHAAHGLLYLLMFTMPVSGYVMTSAGGYPLPFYGLFDWPHLVSKSKDVALAARAGHYWMAWAIGAVIALHIAAAIWHARVKRDGVLERMTRDDPASV